MRCAWILTAVITASLCLAADDKKNDKKAPIEPIKVVQLDRKDPVTFEKDIAPILANKCEYCHSGPVKEAKFDMGSFETLMKGGKRGVPIVPGKPQESLLVKLAGRAEKPMMPPKSEEPLTPEELALIKLWIEQGARAPTGAKIAKRETKLTRVPDVLKPVVALAVSADKSTVVAGRGSHLHVYDAGSGTYIRTLVNPDLKDDKGAALGIAHLDIVQSLAFSSDGRWIASGGFREVILWDAQTGMVRRKLTDFVDRIVCLDFSKDGKLLAAGGGAPTEDGEIKLFEVATGKLVLDIKNGHSDTVFGVRFSPDGTKLAACAADKFVKVFELPSGKFLKAFEGHTHHVMDVGWRGDGKILASCGADNVIKVWDYERGEQTRTINAHGKQITRMVFIGNSANVATCSGDASVKFFNVDNGGNVRNFGGSNDYLYAVSASPDGSVVAAGGEESVVRLYNGINGQLLKSLLPPGSEPEKAKK